MIELISKETGTKVTGYIESVKTDYDFCRLEENIQTAINEVVSTTLVPVINELLSNKVFLSLIIKLAGRQCLSYKEHRPLQITILNGISITVNSPYFYRKASPKRGRKKKGRKKGNEISCHFGLRVIGIIGRYSQNLVSQILQMALLCPSIDCCKAILKERGIDIDTKTIRRLCRDVGQIGISNRGKVSIGKTENIKGKTILVGLDGGRYRERKCKKGRKPKGAKRQGFDTDWKEPKLFTIMVLNQNGEIDRDFSPIYDATVFGKDEVFKLLESYLRALNISQADRLVFVADGAPWIWLGFEELTKSIQNIEVHQVLDYTHAKQALGEIRELLDIQGKANEKLWNNWVNYLWNGELENIERSIKSVLKGKKQTQALKKFKNYFWRNKARMQYAQFKEQNIPSGSGCVESAIRRVINLRIKSAGSFWLPEMAEYFLFLRAQLLSGRWSIFMNNLKIEQ